MTVYSYVSHMQFFSPVSAHYKRGRQRQLIECTNKTTMQPGTQRSTASMLVLVLAAVVQLATCGHNLEEEYSFSAILDDGYTLHWNFDLEQQTITFAVNVSTTGWVGFGLSPNGQMPQSDVVIGWVDSDGNTQFHVSCSL